MRQRFRIKKQRIWFKLAAFRAARCFLGKQLPKISALPEIMQYRSRTILVTWRCRKLFFERFASRHVHPPAEYEGEFVVFQLGPDITPAIKTRTIIPRPRYAEWTKGRELKKNDKIQKTGVVRGKEERERERGGREEGTEDKGKRTGMATGSRGDMKFRAI
jgi:hypothetical protein